MYELRLQEIGREHRSPYNWSWRFLRWNFKMTELISEGWARRVEEQKREERRVEERRVEERRVEEHLNDTQYLIGVYISKQIFHFYQICFDMDAKMSAIHI
jgi:hypothetical protein